MEAKHAHHAETMQRRVVELESAHEDRAPQLPPFVELVVYVMSIGEQNRAILDTRLRAERAPFPVI